MLFPSLHPGRKCELLNSDQVDGLIHHWTITYSSHDHYSLVPRLPTFSNFTQSIKFWTSGNEAMTFAPCFLPGHGTPPPPPPPTHTHIHTQQRAQQAVPRLQALNPNVTVSADTEKVEEKLDEYFKQFNVICATCCSSETLVS